MPARIDIPVGTRFGRLVTLEARAVNELTMRCRCDCGGEAHPWVRSLIEGRTFSCGCKRQDVAREKATAHGHAVGPQERTPTYRTWLSMRRRCSDPTTAGYENYGGRGITVCDRWQHSFAAFLADMGERPDGKTLDRIDPDGNYEPTNCRWATRVEQRHNRRRSA